MRKSSTDTGSETPAYGFEDTSFRAAGGEDGIRALVDDFYRIMAEWPGGARILSMHPDDISISRDKLYRFLCGWLGGPKRYSEKYGPIKIPSAHAHLDIAASEHDAWLSCMEQAIALQPFADDFKVYLLEQLRVPAGRIVEVCRGAKR